MILPCSRNTPAGGTDRTGDPMARRRPRSRGLSRAMPLLLLLFTALPAKAQPLCLCLRCALLTHHSFYVTGSAMHPTLRLDTCLESRHLRDGEPVPAPGSVIHYLHPTRAAIFVTRIVAHEGQTVQMIDGRLHIDATPVTRMPMAPYQELFETGSSGAMPVCPEPVGIGAVCEIRQFRETLPNGTSYAVLDIRDGGPGDETEPFTVPAGHVFVLGDNRDNAVDSRMPQIAGGVGFLPVENIRGIIDRPATTLP